MQTKTSKIRRPIISYISGWVYTGNLGQTTSVSYSILPSEVNNNQR